jgi:HD-like signal output (HDOD) protein
MLNRTARIIKPNLERIMTDTIVKPDKPWALKLVPPFPTVATRLISMVNNENVSTTMIGSLIKLDPTFTAELLRIANSALFGMRREVTSITHALSVLGLERVKNMALLVALNSMVKSAVRIDALRRFWIHSLVTAILTEEAARVSGFGAESAYTAGLLHNLGNLGLISAYPEAYTRMLDVSVEYGFDLIQTERDLFEIDHCAAGAFLASEWHLPDSIVSVASKHHEAPVSGGRTLDNLVRVCWRLAESLGFVAFPSKQTWTYDELVSFVPGFANAWVGAGAEQAKATLDSRLVEISA